MRPGFLLNAAAAPEEPRIQRDRHHRQIEMAIEGGHTGLIGPVLAGRDPGALRIDQDVAALPRAVPAAARIMRFSAVAWPWRIDRNHAGAQQEESEQR